MQADCCFQCAVTEDQRCDKGICFSLLHYFVLKATGDRANPAVVGQMVAAKLGL